MAFTDGYLVSEFASVFTFVDLLLVFSLFAKAGTVGALAVPARSPANRTLPGAKVVASATPVPTAL